MKDQPEANGKEKEKSFNRDREDYLEDLIEIKSLIREDDERPVLEVWAWYSWAILIFAGTIVNFLLYTYLDLTEIEYFLYIWIPVLLLGSTTETAALISRSNREKMPIFTRRFNRFFLSFLGTMIIIIVLTVELLQYNIPLPGIFLLFSSLPMMFYAIITFMQIFIEAFLTLTLGLVFLLSGADSLFAYLFAGILAGLSILISGIHSHLLDKKRKQELDRTKGE